MTVTEQRTLTMSAKEREYLKALTRVKHGTLSCRDAAESLGISERHFYRLRARHRTEGDEGLIHRLRGCLSNRGYSRTLRTRILALYRERYSDYGPTLFAEQIAARDGDDQLPPVDHDTIRRWLIRAGLWSTTRARKAHRRKRERRAQIGSLVQFDGSHHDWFEGRGPVCCLLVAIDDASGRVFMRFAPSENTREVLRTLQAYVERYGIPRELYTDRATVYHPKSKGDRPTDVGRALGKLGVKMILAHSPQAKGRVERSNRTHQDRLVKALRQHQINSIDAANRFLDEAYLADHNTRFASTTRLRDVHRSCDGIDLQNIFCFETTRHVHNDYTITLGNQFIQLERSQDRSAASPIPPPGRTVTVRRWLDDSLHLFWNNDELLFSLCRPANPRRSQHTTPRLRLRPSADHPWRHKSPIGRRGRLLTEQRTKNRNAQQKKSVPSNPASP